MNRFLNILKLCQHDLLTCGLRKGQESMTPRLLSWATKWMHGHLLKWRRLRAQFILVMKYQKFCLGYVVWDACQTINCTDQAGSWVFLEITGYRHSEIKELVKCNPEKLVELNPSLAPNCNWLSIGHKIKFSKKICGRNFLLPHFAHTLKYPLSYFTNIIFVPPYKQGWWWWYSC